MCFTAFNFILGFQTFLLTDEKYYDIPEDEVASRMGKVSLYSALIKIPFTLVLGFVFDVFGRRIPLVLGMLMLSASIFCMPLGKNLYPGYLIFSIMLSLGMNLAGNAPLLPDYVQKATIGKG